MKKVNCKRLGILALSGFTVLIGNNVASAFTPVAIGEYVIEPMNVEVNAPATNETYLELIEVQNDYEVNGIVEDVLEDRLMINESQLFEIPDNPYEELVVLDTENEDWKTVLINEDTVFEILEVANGGLNGEEDITRTEATIDDEMDQVTIHGYESEDGFVAEKVEIWTFTGEWTYY